MEMLFTFNNLMNGDKFNYTITNFKLSVEICIIKFYIQT